MSGNLFVKPSIVPVDSSGQPLANATYTFYVSGTTTTAAIYADANLSASLGNPVTADAAGVFPPIWLDPAVTYRSVLLTSGGALVEDVDPYPANPGFSPYPAVTAAETLAGVTATNFYYVESDIRRYGATVDAVDNSAAIHFALLVSAAGGNAAHIPGGTWPITAAVVVPAGSSMYGHGKSSVLSVANGINGLSFTASDDGITAQPRFFRDFRIVGTLSGTTNEASGIKINLGLSTFVCHAMFQNIAIFNFRYGMYVRGAYYTTIESCFIQNCYNGIYFQDQSVNVYCLNNTIQLTSATALITASGFSTGISCQGAPEIEGLHIQGGSLYGYNYALKFALIFECQVNAVDISYSTMCPIYFASTIGGMVIRDCWIELGSSATGTWNSSATGNLTGVFVAAVTPSANAKVHIHGNYIISDVAITGSTGVYIGNSNTGMTVVDNQIIGFDVGIGGGNSVVNTGTASSGVVIKNNTINLVQNTTTTGVYSTGTTVLVLNSLGTDMETGPNYIVPGTGAAATIAATSTITVPNQATAGNQQFPIGTPVGCTVTLAGGPDARVTYFVIASSTTAVTIGPIAGGAATVWSGTGSIGSLRQLPLPVIYTSGTPDGVTFFGRGAFILTLSNPAVSGVCLWNASGKNVVLTPVGTFTGVSGATTMSGTGLPAFLAPGTTQNAACSVENSGGAASGMVAINTAGAMTFYTTALAVGFTNDGLTKGLLNVNIVYSLA